MTSKPIRYLIMCSICFSAGYLCARIQYASELSSANTPQPLSIKHTEAPVIDSLPSSERAVHLVDEVETSTTHATTESANITAIDLHDSVEPVPVNIDDIANLLSRARSDDEVGRIIAAVAQMPLEKIQPLLAQLSYDSDPRVRALAYKTIERMGLHDTEARLIIAAALTNETDADALLNAIQATNRTQLPDGEKDMIVARLSKHLQHPDAEIRALSLYQTAQWNPNALSQDQFRTALDDSNATVKSAALNALAFSTEDITPYKDDIFKLAGDADATYELRSSAMAMIENLSLSETEYQRYLALRATYKHDEHVNDTE